MRKGEVDMGVKGKRCKIWWRLFLSIIIAGLGIGAYAMYIEPRLLITKKVTLRSKYITKQMDGFKIVQFTDTQLGKFYTAEDLKRAVKAINKVGADVVIFTGDLIDHMKTYKEDINYIANILGEIEASYGKYAIYGNHDQGGGAHRVYPEIMKKAEFKLLDNAIENIGFEDGQMNIIGIDDWLLGYPELDTTLNKVDEDHYNIVLIHEPDVADLTIHYPIDLQLSGHTHGGQVKIPFIGPLITPPVGHKYTDGVYSMNKRLTLYVNTGLGNTKVPFRFMNIPEITVFKLKYTE